MPYAIRPTTPDDLPELGRFLAEGFHASREEAKAFASADVLGWKYFDPIGPDAGAAPKSYLARDPDTGAVVGHLGVCLARFRGPGLPEGGVSTLHMIDWLTSRTGTGAGAAMMRRAYQGVDAPYGFGGSVAGRTVGERGGYALVAGVPVYRRVLRPFYRLHGPDPLPGRLLRAAKDAAGRLARPGRAPSAPVALERAEAFGPEVGRVLDAYAARATFTTRGAELLNHLLRYPRGGITGWRVLRGGRLRGFGVLTVVPREGGRVREGKLVDCLLDDPDDDDLWLAAVAALTTALAGQGADVAVAAGSAPWTARALGATGYARTHALEFRLRDRDGRLPRDVPYHLTFLEADYAYT